MAVDKKFLNSIVKGINTHFKKNVVNLGGDIMEDLIVKFIKTPSLKVNKVLGGGIATGRITEIYGPTGSGKTTLCYETIGNDMKLDPDSIWAWYETEKSFDIEIAKFYGVDPDRLIYWEMGDEGAETGLDVLESVIRKSEGKIKGAVINSVAGLTPKSELDALMGKLDMGTQAKMMSKLMRKIIAIAGKNKMAIIFINQIRDKISLFGGTTTPGGRALSFFASQRIEMRKNRVEAADGVKDTDYIKMIVKVVKNRFAKGNPYVQTTIFARYGVGIDVTMETLELAVEQNVIEKKAGGNYRFVTDAGEEVKFRGAANLMDYVDKNPEFAMQVRARIKDDFIATTTLSDEDLAKLETYNTQTSEVIQDANTEVASEESNETE